jgi:hypothetical protein
METISDQEIYTRYLQGFRDELDGKIKSNTILETDILGLAYRDGMIDAYCGDDNPNIDARSKEETIKSIKKQFKNE